MRLRVLAMMLLVSVPAPLTAQGIPNIKSDETILFFPAIITPTADGGWEFRVHGWIYEPQSEMGLALGSLRSALGLDDEDEDAASRGIFRERARTFLVDNERGKRVCIRLGEKAFDCELSQPNGHFFGKCRMTADEIARLRIANPKNPSEGKSGAITVEFTADLSRGDRRRFAGTAHILTGDGISVVSDIDDTVKVSEVRDRKALLKNTFLRPFRPAPGMADLYADWGKAPNTSFHYVSGSPWQLYPPVEEFRLATGLPAGTYHLKLFRWKDESFLNLFQGTREHKIAEIEWLMNACPKRRFVLVGDSGEMDPEIYGEVARRNPGRVMRIVIRDVTGETADDPRYATAFKDVPNGAWFVVKDPSEAPRKLP